MPTKPPTITMTSFARFVVADAGGKLARVREIKRRYDKPYSQGQDFWKNYRGGIDAIHRRGGKRSDVEALWKSSAASRMDQYKSACEGYAKFWGSKHIESLAAPKPAIWTHDRLSVRVQPELFLRVNGKAMLIKLHTDHKSPLDQRLANPLLYLIETLFPGDHQAALLDVHRGKPWSRRTEHSNYESVLRMQAAAFLAGWDIIEAEEDSAAS
jgi:hypothetical protein